MKQLANFIHGEYTPAQNGKYFDGYNPATGKAYYQIPDSNHIDVDLAVTSCIQALSNWKRTPVEKRAQQLYRIADLIEKNLKSLAAAESEDQGKPVHLAEQVDIPRAAANFRFFAGAILHHEESATHMDGKALNYTIRQPLGVVGLISPWNLPLYLLTWKVAPAIAVGNTVVCKPSEHTSMTAYMLCDIFNQAELPPGVCNIIFGTGPQAGDSIVTHKDIPAISFTGGTKTAETIISHSAPYFKKLGLELGGKNPNIIFADADLDKCIKTTIRSSFQNQGEICLCGSRILVEQSIYQDFLQRFKFETEKLQVGDPKLPNTDLGPLVSSEHRKKVEYYINLAKTEGGKIITGGEPLLLKGDLGKGNFVSPTIIVDLPISCRVMQEEIFGPVVTVTPFDTVDEAITIANDTKYGLSASVWTQDLSRAHRVAQALDSGTIWVNTWLMRDLRVPFGGLKASGIGREGGSHSIDFYTELKTVSIKF